ncbi:FG-GAP-like repeat-containing protein [soil metagenome]
MRNSSALLGLVFIGFSASIVACSGGTSVTTDPGVALTYGAPFLLPCSNAHVAVADVDGDGHGDLVTTCATGSGPSDVKVYRSAAGALADPIVTRVTSSGYLFDVDADGSADYITNDSVYFGKGDGHFASAVKAKLPSGDKSFDVDGDGYPDVLAYDISSHEVTAVSILGDASTKVIFKVANVDNWPSFGDLDGDGKLDMFYAMGSAVMARFGKGVGIFTPAQAIVTADMAVGSVRAIEIDGDGHMDLKLALGASATVGYALLRNQGDGTFVSVKTIPKSGSVSYDFLDANGDGRVDVVLTEGEQLMVLPGTGSGTFLDGTLITGPWSHASGAQFADVNGDGRTDLVVADGSVSVLLRK